MEFPRTRGELGSSRVDPPPARTYIRAVGIHPARSRLTLLRLVAATAVRRTFAALVLLGFVAGLLRAAFPVIRHRTANAANAEFVTTQSGVSVDDGIPSVDEARPIRIGARRAAFLVNAGLPSLAGSADDGWSSRMPADRRDAAPASVAPSPPFHPPRTV